MSKRKETTIAPEPLEEYIRPFDGLFEKWNQREGFRQYLEGLLLPTERNKTLTGLANTEPVVGAQHRHAQFLQWLLSESDWDERTVQQQRLSMLLEDPLTAPTGHGVLVIDEHADRKAGTHMAHVGRQCLRKAFRALGLGYVMALKPSHDWWHEIGTPGSLKEVAQAAGWKSTDQPGQWVKVIRTFRDGSKQTWWALEVKAGPYGPEKTERAVIATTDPETLPDATTWYLVTNLPAPGSTGTQHSTLPEASLEEIIRLYGLRMWIEQSYKQVREALGWADYQVRSDRAIRRHWQLVCCAFSFCWYHHSHSPPDHVWLPESSECQMIQQEEQVPQRDWGAGEKKERTHPRSTAPLLAKSPAKGESLVGAVDSAAALLEGLVRTAPDFSASAVT